MRKVLLKKYIKVFLWISVLIFPKMLIVLQQNPIRISDEVGTLAATAYFAGMDWSDIWGMVSYYGTGYHILFIPLFKITSDPYIIYRIILFSYVILETIVGIIVFFIIKRYFPYIKEEYAFFISIIISYLQHSKVTWISNESVIFFLCWLTLYICLKLFENIDNTKNKTIYTIILCVILAYSLTVHTRLAIMYIAILAVGLYVFVCTKKILIMPSIGCIMTIICTFVALNYNEWVQEIVWLQYRKTEYLHNANMSGNVSKILNIFKIFDKEYLIAFLDIIIGQLSTAAIMSCGIFILGSILSIIFIFKSINKKNRIEEIQIWVGIIAVFGIVCNYATLGAQSVLWLELAKETIDISKITTIVDASHNFSRVFVYMRYFAPFMGIIVFIACIYIVGLKVIKGVYKMTYLLVLCGQVYWIEYILPILKSNITTATVYIPFSLSEYSQECSILVYIPASLILILVMGGIGRLTYKKRSKTILIILLISIIYQYMYYGLVHKNEWHNRADSGYQLVHKIENYIDLKDNIYVPYKAMAYTYQIMLFKHKINVGVPNDDIDQAMLFTNKYVLGENDYRYNEYISEKGYKSYKLDWNEFVYVKGDELIEIMETLGY